MATTKLFRMAVSGVVFATLLLSLPSYGAADEASASAIAGAHPTARSTPQELLALLGQYIDARDVDAILAIHEPEAGVVEYGGGVARGADEIRALYVDFFKSDPDLKANAIQIIEVGGVAIILGDYTLDYLDESGNIINAGGKFGDMVRQQPDGSWLYLLDNPYAP